MILREVTGVLEEFGQAIRGDWGSIDGRSIRSSLSAFTPAIHEPERYTAEYLRDILGICPNGHGHWEYYCEEDCKKDEK